MTENEQIMEMARALCGMKSGCDRCIFNRETCYERKDAEALYSKGYRKASEVAREVFEELEATFHSDGFHYFIATAVFDSLKKKYTEGEK